VEGTLKAENEIALKKSKLFSILPFLSQLLFLARHPLKQVSCTTIK